MSLNEKIETFLSAPAFAVVGASDIPHKWGHKCYMTYLKHNYKAYPVNPNVKEINGNEVYPNLDALPEKVESISVITPPPVTEKVVEEAIAHGVKNVWMQPGAESAAAVKRGEEAGLNIIYGGPCLMVQLGW